MNNSKLSQLLNALSQANQCCSHASKFKEIMASATTRHLDRLEEVLFQSVDIVLDFNLKTECSFARRVDPL